MKRVQYGFFLLLAQCLFANGAQAGGSDDAEKDRPMPKATSKDAHKNAQAPSTPSALPSIYDLYGPPAPGALNNADGRLCSQVYGEPNFSTVKEPGQGFF